jgi:UDP-glucuronate decarboxylase
MRQNKNARRVLVTGGAGFLGSHLCDRLIARGDEVLCVDSFLTGREANLAHLLDHPRFTLHRHDVTQPFDAEVDEIYSLACPASPPRYQHDPIHTLRTSVLGALNLLDLARKRGARILQASTSEVYGDPLQHPQSEGYWGHVNPVGLRSCYDEGKRCAETLFMDYHRQHGLDVRIVRIFNTYGPRMDPQDGRVVSNFIVQALRGEPLTLYGEGTQTRSFCFVDDLVEGFLRFMDKPGFTGPLNLGNPGEFTVAQLAQQVLALTGSRSKCVHLPLPADDPTQRRPDIHLAQSQLGWKPQVALQEGLVRTIEWFRQEMARSAQPDFAVRAAA